MKEPKQSNAAAQRSRALLITPAGIAGTVVLALVVLTCLRLGFWQLDRLEQRRTINAGIASRLDLPPIPDITSIADTAGLAYRTTVARGRFDESRHIILPGRSRQGVPGVHLLVPLRLAGRADAVLVNRGWVPAPDAATIDVRDFAVPDTVAVRGLILPFPGAEQSLARRATREPSDSFRHVLYAIDEDALRARFPYPMLDVMLQQIDPPRTGRYPAPIEPPPLDEGPHLGYALQWFAFAIIGIIGWFALVLRPRRAAAALLAFGAALAAPAPAAAQLRPLEPLEWRVFTDDAVVVAGAGAGILFDQPAPLAGTRGTLLEIGRYSLAVRSGRIAIHLGGTALWRLSERDTTTAAAPEVQAADGTRQDAGPAWASTIARLSPDRWPVDVMLRFGATIPTTSDESGLDRDRTDFFALIGLRYRNGPWSVTAENGVGINGTRRSGLPQSDVWTYGFGAAWSGSTVRVAADLSGRQDGHAYVIRGNEDTRELRLGFDAGRARWVRIRYVLGLDEDAAPAHGLIAGAGITVGGR